MTRRVWWSWTLGVCLVVLAGCSSSKPEPKPMTIDGVEYIVPTSVEPTVCPPPACTGTGNPIEDLFAQLCGPG